MALIPPVLIVSADSALYGTFEDAYEDVKKYVFSTIISPYTPQNMQAVLETLQKNPCISTILTRGIWYHELLESEYIRQHPAIRVEQLVVDMRISLQELNELFLHGYKRICIVSVNSPLGIDPPEVEDDLRVAGMHVYSTCITDMTDPVGQILSVIQEHNVEVLWGDAYEFEDPRLASIPKYRFGIRGKTLSAMLHHAADYAMLLATQSDTARIAEFLGLMVNIVSEGILLFYEDGSIFASNNNFIISRFSAPLTGLLVQDVAGISLPQLMTMPANTLVVIEKHRYIANVLRTDTADRKRFALVLTSARQVSDIDLSARTQLTKGKFPARYCFEDLIIKAPVSAATMHAAQAYAQYDETVLITGETGTGKELYASSIHRASLRSEKPFVAINCATFSESLIDSELFGYEKGAFTGALSAGKKGLFELAHQGTIFLDEISEMPLQLQTKLLRVLQEKCLMRVGGSEVIPVDVRVIAATNKNLLEQCKAGHFRYDLYYRLALLELTLAPLRERREDIIPLFEFFLGRNIRQSGRKLFWKNSAIFSELLTYSWPGNIRELENTALRTIILADGLELTEKDVRRAMPKAAAQKAAAPDSSMFSIGLTDDLDELEKEYLCYLMRLMNNSREEVCRFLHISKPTLWRKLNYGTAGKS